MALSNDDLEEEIRKLREALQSSDKNETITHRLIKSNNKSLIGLSESLISSYNFTNKFSEAINKFDKNQLRSLATGTTYNKFLEANTKALTDRKASFEQTSENLISNFEAGIRVNSEQLNHLNDEMSMTGQNTKALIGVNTQLLAITGNDVMAVNKNAETNRKLSKDYLISNDRLIETMESMAENLNTLSFFGTEAVGNMSEVAKELQGRVGVGMKSQIEMVMGMLLPTLDNMGKQALGGTTGAMNAVTEGMLEIADLNPLFSKVLKVNEQMLKSDLKSGAPERAANLLDMTEQQYNATLQLAKAMKNETKITSEMRMSEADLQKSIAQSRKNADDFFMERAPDIHKGIVAIAPAMLSLAISVNALGMGAGLLGGGKGAYGMGQTMGKLGKFAKFGSGAAGAAGGLYSASQGDYLGAGLGGAMTGFSMGGPLGAAVGGAIGVGAALIGTYFNTEKTADELEEANRIEERTRREKTAESTKVANQLSYIGNFLRSGTVPQVVSDPALNAKITELIRESKKTTAATKEVGKSNPLDDN